MSDHTNDNIFKDMREQMTPSPAAMERLAVALETERPQASRSFEEAAGVSSGPASAQPAQGEGAPGVPGATPAPASFGAAASQAPRAPQAPRALQPPQASRAAQAKRRQRRRFAAYLSTATAAVLVLIAVTFTLVTGNLPFTGTKVGSLGSGRHNAVAEVSDVRAPVSYDELYGILVETGSMAFAGDYVLSDTVSDIAETASSGDVSAPAPSAEAPVVMMPTMEEPTMEAPAPSVTSDTPQAALEPAKETADSSAGTVASSEGYSETNVQVKGIDEGDIVKTDGSNIYALSRSELVIFKADGANTSELSRTRVAVQGESVEASGQLRWYRYEYPVEMFIDGTTLVAVTNDNSYGNPDDLADPADPASSTTNSSPAFDALGLYGPYGPYGSQTSTRVAFYDISDPTSPRLVAQFSQSGLHNTARLNGGILYLVSSYYLYQGIDDDDPITYVPLLGEGAGVSPMAIADIRLMPSVDSANYTVVTSYDVAAATRTDQKSVLGNAETVYMSPSNLYLGSTVWVNEEKEPYQESVYTVEEHITRVSTQLVRIAIDGGALTVAAQCTVGGQLLNQFSLDEYEGNLRLAVTHNDYSYRIYRDPSHGVESYRDNITDNANSLLVLDSALSVIGSIEGLAADERIYSVRFTGPVGYMVTYRQVDPLFALDLSDPTNPRVTSELKIPGFSTYLHPFTEGRLLGLGYDAEGVRRLGMKLSMFDIADPFAVGERFTRSVETYSSEALSNHKAVLVDAARDLIGFPGNDWGSNVPVYFVYGYSDTGGFMLKAKLTLDTEGGYYYSEGTRGIYIGSYLYVYTGISLHVFDLESFEGICFIEVQDPTEPYYFYGKGYFGGVPGIEPGFAIE